MTETGMTEIDSIVFVIDDDPSILKAISRFLRNRGLTVEVFASAGAFLERSHHDGPGCLVLDLCLPGLTGLELQKQLVAAGYRLPIIFITGHGDIPSTVMAMKGGAVDFLPKPFDNAVLLAAIHQALEKDRIARQVRAEVDDIQTRFERLTPREHDVTKLLVQGMLNKQVASDLGISIKTVKIHRARVMEKMRIRSVAELVHLKDQVNSTPSPPPA